MSHDVVASSLERRITSVFCSFISRLVSGLERRITPVFCGFISRLVSGLERRIPPVLCGVISRRLVSSLVEKPVKCQTRVTFSPLFPSTDESV